MDFINKEAGSYNGLVTNISTNPGASNSVVVSICSICFHAFIFSSVVPIIAQPAATCSGFLPVNARLPENARLIFLCYFFVL